MKLNSITYLSALIVTSLISLSQHSHAKSLADDVNDLGGNKTLLKLSSELSPDKKIRVVQQRLVDRTNRLEFTGKWGSQLSGQSYLQTQSLEVGAEYHINPRWSLGVIYSDYTHKLSPEGERVFSEAKKSFYSNQNIAISYPDIDVPGDSVIGQIQFYPIYGKLNFFDQSIIQFDISMILGAGQINLTSGPTQITNLGIGSGFWINKNILARFEVKYNNYKDKDLIYKTSRDLEIMTGHIGIGVFL